MVFPIEKKSRNEALLDNTSCIFHLSNSFFFLRAQPRQIRLLVPFMLFDSIIHRFGVWELEDKKKANAFPPFGRPASVRELLSAISITLCEPALVLAACLVCRFRGKATGALSFDKDVN